MLIPLILPQMKCRQIAGNGKTHTLKIKTTWVIHSMLEPAKHKPSERSGPRGHNSTKVQNIVEKRKVHHSKNKQKQNGLQLHSMPTHIISL